MVAVDFPDGVVVVSLASIPDAGLVASAIAGALGDREAGDRAIEDSLVAALQDKSLLLVLDDFEHVADAAPLVAHLLMQCPKLYVLVASRTRLQLRGEQELEVPPLALPDPAHLPPTEELRRYPAIELFLQRAHAVQAGFQLTEANAPVIAEICRRLDGLPLAIELAAARIRALPPEALLKRLERRLAVLAGGARDAPERQRTMRDTIAWSHDLLQPDEQRLFARLAVFAGGCTFAAVENVCDLEGALDSLEGVGSLLDKSLLRQDPSTAPGEADPRFSMLETTREYAAEKLEERGERDEIQAAHARYFLQLAEEVEPQLTGPRQRQGLDQLEAELDNIRPALAWFLQHGQAAEALRLASALYHFWYVRGYWSEGLKWLEAGLTTGDELPPDVRARALYSMSWFVADRGSHDRATRLLDEALLLFEQLGDKGRSARTRLRLGEITWAHRDEQRATQLHEEALALYRELGDHRGSAKVLGSLGIMAAERGDYGQAGACFGEALIKARQSGDTSAVANYLNNLGFLALGEGLLEEANARLEEGLSLARELGLKSYLPALLDTLGCVATKQGDYARSAELFTEGLRLARELGSKEAPVLILGHMAELVALQGETTQAVRLWGAEDAAREALGVPLLYMEREGRQRAMERARRSVGEGAWSQLWKQGGGMSLEEAVAHALGERA
jgi:predicted ATPase